MVKDLYGNMSIEQLKAELKTFENASNDPSFTKAQRTQAEKEARIIRVKLMSSLTKSFNKTNEK